MPRVRSTTAQSMAANLVVWCEILEAQWSVYKKLHELSITNLCLILGIMNEADKQVTNGHGAEDSGMAKKNPLSLTTSSCGRQRRSSSS